MVNKLNRYFACLLLVLLPLQALAAANMSICNSMMETESAQQKTVMPHCNMHISDATQNAKQHLPQKQNDSCKTHCASLCASLCAMTTLPSNLGLANLPAASKKIFSSQVLYTSISLASLQRPPIHLS
ncbi:MAG: hypothetical protein ACKVOA_05625 [Methylophilaceae bacterium]